MDDCFFDVIILGIFVAVSGKISVNHSVILILTVFLLAALSIYLAMIIYEYAALLCAGIICFIWYVIINIIIKRDRQKFTRHEICILLFNTSISIVIIYFLMSVDREFDKYCGIICVVINYMIVLRMIYRIKEAQQKEREQQKKLSDMELQEQYMKSVYMMDANTRKIRHDLKNHLNTICVLLEDENKGREKTIDYIRQYINQTAIMYETVKTDNDVVNAVINSKLLYCTEHDISTSTSVSKIIDKLSDVEMCTILGNLLDNAIEAELMIDMCEREIKLNIDMEGDVLNIFMKNKIKESVLQKNHNLKTSKHDIVNHGIGMKNIYDIILKHNGYIDIYEENDYICFDIKI